MNAFGTLRDTIDTPKEWFLSKNGPKEGVLLKEWREVTFMKEWVKPLYISTL